MKRFFKLMLGATMLMPVLSSCSSDDDETIDDWFVLDDNNSTVYVEFDAAVKDLNGSDYVYDLKQFKVYGFNTALGQSVFGDTRSKTAQGVDVTRNKDDETMWDYVDSKTNAMLKWANLIKYPISFYGIGGEGAAFSSIGSKNNLPTLKVELPASKDGKMDAYSVRDLLFANALRLDPHQYLNDSTKVDLDFEHILPMIQLRANLAKSNDLEVTVQSSTLMGFVTAVEYDFNEVKPEWTPYTPENATATTNMEISLKEPIVLNQMGMYLQSTPVFVLPQSVKPWSSVTKKDGAGIKLMARVRSKASGNYLVGSDSSFGEVFITLDNATYQPGNVYTLDITFNSIYNADGSLGYRASYKPIVTPWQDKVDNIVLQ